MSRAVSGEIAAVKRHAAGVGTVSLVPVQILPSSVASATSQLLSAAPEALAHDARHTNVYNNLVSFQMFYQTSCSFLGFPRLS